MHISKVAKSNFTHTIRNTSKTEDITNGFTDAKICIDISIDGL